MKHNYTRKQELIKALQFKLSCPTVRSIIQSETRNPAPGIIMRVRGLGVEQYALVDHNRNITYLVFGDWIVEEIDGTIYVVKEEKFKEQYYKEGVECIPSDIVSITVS